MGPIANIGTLVASAINMIVLPILHWRAVFIICGILGVLVVILCIFFLEESPRWLAMKGKNDKADAIVSRLEKNAAAKGGGVDDVPEEEIKRRESEEVVKDLPWSFLFRRKSYHSYAYGNAALLYDERSGLHCYFLDAYRSQSKWL